MPLPRIAIATGDPAGIGPEIALKAALDARVRGLCRPLLVGDPAAVELHAKAAGLTPRLNVIANAAEADWSDGALNLLDASDGTNAPVEVRQGGRRLRPRLARQRAARDQSRARGRGRGGGGGAADRALDCRRRHRLRRLSLVRRARDRHAGQRRLSDDLLRRQAHRARHLACQRARGGGADYARARRARHPRRRCVVEKARHRAAEDFRQRAQSACRRRRHVRLAKKSTSSSPAIQRRRRFRHRRHRARSAPTPCSAKKAATPSSSCCTTRATSPPSCRPSTAPPACRSARRFCFLPSRTAAPTTSPARVKPIPAP